MTKKLPEWVVDEPVEKTAHTQQNECYIHSEPLGVVLIISYWNFPFTITIQPMVGAIAAGTMVPFLGVMKAHYPLLWSRARGLRPSRRWVLVSGSGLMSLSFTGDCRGQTI